MRSLTYKYRGARATIILHEREMRRFLNIWREAKGKGIILPVTDDSSYKSLEALLHHVLRASRGYIIWMCQVLNLPDLEIRKTPGTDTIEAEADDYLEYLLERWKFPLVDITEEQAHIPTYTSRWKVEYCIDSMLEHAVMHPIRHSFQLEELIAS
ncbi:MAG: hypothetical protein P9X24_17910 [Candidatus Hatepunaea meridiana]|nr:hypothetical protein [Candidatus Hatepunaea meridiana]